MPGPATLNPDQHAAVYHPSGPLLVLAGAGSGKTRVVTERIARLIHNGVPPNAIVAMTFTNKAAAEMLERVTRLVGPRAEQVTIGTFHAFGLQVLRQESRYVGIADGRFTILDQADQASVVREILREPRNKQKWDVYEILSRISEAKNNFIDPENFEPAFRDPYDDITEWVYPRYLRALQTYHALDFDDLVCQVVRLFRNHPAVLQKWQAKYWSILVDEYQDTNHAQFQLVQLLGGEHKNVCVVGDDDQSIYAWRGADPRNILEFEQHFANATVIKLQHSYRSTEAILRVANAIIHSSLSKRHEKRLIATLPGGDKVRTVIADSAETEAGFIAEEISLYLQNGTPAADIAVLYRSNQQSEPIETALRQLHIEYRLIGGTQFYERKEVKDLIAYLRVLVNSRDELSLRRIINYPSRGIGPTSIERLSNYALASDCSLWQAILRASQVPELASDAIRGCQQLAHIIESSRASLHANTPSASIAQQLINDTDMLKDIAAGSSNADIAARRRNNLASLQRVLARFDAQPDASNKDLWALLQRLSLSTDPEKTTEDGVTLSTMHGAKGLEFQTVFIAGLEEGLIPHARATNTVGRERASNIEEERRLFYVAVTRAQKHLYLCRAATRTTQGRRHDRTPSRFLKTIPQALLTPVKAKARGEATHQAQLDGIARLLEALK